MKPFVAVIGGQRAGKSTVICSLTGCSKRTHRGIVTDRATKKSIYVIASSPQEQDLEKEEFKKILDTTTGEDSILGLVMAIQPTEPRVRMSMEDIFREVQATGRFRSFAMILHPSYEDTGGSPDPNDVRRRLKALNVDLHEIDGRRFAHINAVAIRELAQIP